jgi:hypothetical protein
MKPSILIHLKLYTYFQYYKDRKENEILSIQGKLRVKVLKKLLHKIAFRI